MRYSSGMSRSCTISIGLVERGARYATSATFKVGISHVRPVLPELLDFVATAGFPAEQVTSLLADWEDAPEAYAAHTSKLVLHRPPLDLGGS